MVKNRFAIGYQLLKLILFEVQRSFGTQNDLQLLYKTIFLLGYYGMMRIGELTASPHVLKAAKVHIVLNKQA